MITRPRCWLTILWVVGFYGCESPWLRLELTLPEAHRDKISALQVDLLQLDNTRESCATIRFGRGGDLIRGGRIQRLLTTPGQPLTLQDLPRDRDTVVVVRASDENGALIAGVCQVIAGLDANESTTVELKAELSTRIRISSVSGDNSLGFGQSLLVDVLDPVGESLSRPGVSPTQFPDVQWELFDVGGAVEDGLAEWTSNADGSPQRAAIELRESRENAEPGPLRLRLRTPWLWGEKIDLTGFKELPSKSWQEDPPSLLLVDRTAPTRARDRAYLGAIGPGGTPGMLTLGPAKANSDGSWAREAFIHTAGHGRQKVAGSSLQGVAVLGGRADGDRDRVVALSSTHWYRLAGDGTALRFEEEADPSAMTNYPNAVVNRLTYAGPCNAAPNGATSLAPLYLADIWRKIPTSKLDFIGTIAVDDDGAAAANPLPDAQAGLSKLTVYDSGCVQDAAQPELRHRALLAIENNTPKLFLLRPGKKVLVLPISGPAASAGFSRSGEFFTLSVIADGLFLARGRISVTDDDKILFPSTRTTPILLVPTAVALGEINGDAALDFVTLVRFGTVPSGAHISSNTGIYRHYVALGQGMASGFSLQFPSDAPSVVLFDFDGDGKDELIRVGRQQQAIRSFKRQTP